MSHSNIRVQQTTLLSASQAEGSPSHFPMSFSRSRRLMDRLIRLGLALDRGPAVGRLGPLDSAEDQTLLFYAKQPNQDT